MPVGIEGDWFRVTVSLVYRMPAPGVRHMHSSALTGLPFPSRKSSAPEPAGDVQIPPRVQRSGRAAFRLLPKNRRWPSVNHSDERLATCSP